MTSFDNVKKEGKLRTHYSGKFDFISHRRSIEILFFTFLSKDENPGDFLCENCYTLFKTV